MCRRQTNRPRQATIQAVSSNRVQAVSSYRVQAVSSNRVQAVSSLSSNSVAVQAAAIHTIHATWNLELKGDRTRRTDKDKGGSQTKIFETFESRPIK